MAGEQEKGKVCRFVDLAEYQEGSIVSRTIIDRRPGPSLSLPLIRSRGSVNIPPFRCPGSPSGWRGRDHDLRENASVERRGDDHHAGQRTPWAESPEALQNGSYDDPIMTEEKDIRIGKALGESLFNSSIKKGDPKYSGIPLISLA